MIRPYQKTDKCPVDQVKKIKYGLSISMLVNIAVKNEIMEEQK